MDISSVSPQERVFQGVFPGGISYADRYREVQGDYARLAFLPYDTLELKFEQDCPLHLRNWITESAAAIQSRRGEQYPISTSGQTVLLGVERNRI
jgi:hypothetical protein